MQLTQIDLAALRVNRSNDRHGELDDEQTAINWLLSRHEAHMKNLARDIVSEKQVYEAPLVSKLRGKFVVFDGNRRVTCLKLLADPDRAPTETLRSFFRSEAMRFSGDLPQSVLCQVESDRDIIDEILYRRHTGSQSGVGQSPWDDAAKHNFIARTGKHSGPNVAEQIEQKLVEIGVIAAAGDLPRSVLNRLLSSEEFRNAVGLSLKREGLFYTHRPDSVASTLEKIADDLTQKRVVLGDLWDNAGKRRYLSELREAGQLPKPQEALAVPSSFAAPLPPRLKATPSVRPTSKDSTRTTLIPTDLDYAVRWCGDNARQRDIWNELQHRLLLERHINAISVTFRVLLELSVDYYITTAKVDTYQSDSLSNKVEKAAMHMQSTGLIDEKYRRELKKFAHAEAIVSANTMNRYVHSATFSPSPKHLTALWDTMAKFIVCSLSAARPEDEEAA